MSGGRMGGSWLESGSNAFVSFCFCDFGYGVGLRLEFGILGSRGGGKEGAIWELGSSVLLCMPCIEIDSVFEHSPN